MIVFVRLLFRNRLAAVGAVVLAVILLLALAVPILPLADPDVTATANRFKPPFSEGHLLGTDHERACFGCARTGPDWGTSRQKRGSSHAAVDAAKRPGHNPQII